MTLKIINPPSNIPVKYNQYIIPKEKYQNIYNVKHGKNFDFFFTNRNSYNKAVNFFMDNILKTVFEKNSEFKERFFKYCEFIIVTSMDRPYSNGSHKKEGNAFDFALYPYFLNPYLHSILKDYYNEFKFNTYLSLNNHHIHFAFSETPNFGFEIAYNKANNKIAIPKKISENFNKELSNSSYDLQITNNTYIFSNSIMFYYGMAGIVSPSILKTLGNISSLLDYVKDGDEIIKFTSEKYNTNYESFINYLKANGMYVDMYDYLKELHGDFINAGKYIKKK